VLGDFLIDLSERAGIRTPGTTSLLILAEFARGVLMLPPGRQGQRILRAPPVKAKANRELVDILWSYSQDDVRYNPEYL
jgi:hypothetical protein